MVRKTKKTPQKTAKRKAMKVSDELLISMKNVSKWFGSFQALREINLDVYKGERIIICGPSGSGKSTLIRCLNALEHHQAGEIKVLDNVLDNNIRHVETIRRDVGMVFQDFNLFRIYPFWKIVFWHRSG